MSKKVLIITYYWPPSGGGGVQRWLKFVKYLPEYGWEPVIFTPENPDFDLKDESLVREVPEGVEVLRFPIWEPYKFFKKLSGKRELKQGQVLEDGKKGLLSKIAIWIRGNLFIPDPRVFWVKPSVEYIGSILSTNEIKTVITTGPPHSVHLIGLGLKKKHPGLRWVADFRDPWSEWDILKQFKMLPMVWARHRKLEAEVFKVANKVIAVSNTWAKDMKKLGARRVEVVTNGFDEADLDEEDLLKKPSEDRFIVSHVGMLNQFRNPKALWAGMENALETDESLREHFTLRLTGILSDEVLGEIRRYPLLSERLELQASIPHKEVFAQYAESSLLLLILNQSENTAGHLPGKLFEYLAARRTILAIGQEDSDAGSILQELEAGHIMGWQDHEKVCNLVAETYKRWLKEEAVMNNAKVSRYSRKQLTGQLDQLLRDL